MESWICQILPNWLHHLQEPHPPPVVEGAGPVSSAASASQHSHGEAAIERLTRDPPPNTPASEGWSAVLQLWGMFW